MAQLKLKYHFTSNAVPEDTFYVLDFHGEEALSTLFRFEITLASRDKGLDPKTLLQEPASLLISGSDGMTPFHGVLADFTQFQQAYGLVIYKATLVPRFWRLTLTQHNQLFLNKSLQQYLATCLQDGGLEQGLDFEFRLSGSYSSREYVCQYNESHFAFVSRWMEHYGLYYFFDQQNEGRLVVTDSKQAHTPLSKSPSLRYSPDTSLDTAHGSEVLTAFAMTQRPMPKQVQLRDWNYRTPDLQMQGKAPVDQQGRGDFNFYGDNFKTPSEGKTLAEIRSQELLCRQQIFHGQSSVPYLCSGFTFSLKNHYRSDFDQDYLLLSVRHEGSQSEHLFDVLGDNSGEGEITYSNSFLAIPDSVQYRAKRQTPWPRFSGVMNAHIDAAGSGEYAEVDDQGRYKVVLPFDDSGRKDGKASSWLRMAQPYGGSDHGFHFPLHKGTEVLLGCIGGNPDRPIILSAAPNPDTPSLVTSANQTKSILTTSGKNTVHFEDKEGEKRVLMHCPAKETWLRLGAPNDPSTSNDDDDDEPESGSKGIKLYTSKALTVFAGSKFKVIMGNASDTYLGLDAMNFSPFANKMVVGFEFGLVMAFKQTIKPIHNKWKETEDSLREAEETEAAVAQTMVDEMTTLRDDITRLEQSVTRLSADTVRMADENTQLAQDKIQLAQDKIKLSQDITRAAETKTTLSQEGIDLSNQITILKNSSMNLSTQVTRLSQSNTRLMADVTRLCQEHTALYEEVNTIGVSINNIAEGIGII